MLTAGRVAAAVLVALAIGGGAFLLGRATRGEQAPGKAPATAKSSASFAELPRSSAQVKRLTDAPQIPALREVRRRSRGGGPVAPPPAVPPPVAPPPQAAPPPVAPPPQAPPPPVAPPPPPPVGVPGGG